MKYRFFTIPVQIPEQATEELNAFLSTHGVVKLERQFVIDGQNSFWAYCAGMGE